MEGRTVCFYRHRKQAHPHGVFVACLLDIGFVSCLFVVAEKIRGKDETSHGKKKR